jgi:acyl-CoA thioester hydrolase
MQHPNGIYDRQTLATLAFDVAKTLSEGMVIVPPDIIPFSGRFEGRDHYFACRVYFEDTDFSGIVYHANYLRYLERARSDMLRCLGVDQRATHDTGGGVYAVADMTLRFVRPAKMDDDLIVMSQITRLRAAACIIHQRVIRRGQSITDSAETLLDAEVTAAFINSDGRPIRQPRAWMDAYSRILNSDQKDRPPI